MPDGLSAESLVGVIGAGAMGAGIAQVAAQSGHRVLLADAQDGAVERALAGIAGELQSLAAKGRLTRPEAEAARARIQPAPASGFGGCGLVVEAIIEDLAAKRALLHGLENIVADEAILASNTSSLSITAMAAGLKRPSALSACISSIRRRA